MPNTRRAGVHTLIHQARGIVIRHKDYAENHKILTIFTETNGKISVMARGARKMRSRLASITQLFTEAHYSYFKGSKGMGMVSQGDTIHSFRDLRQDLKKTTYASYFAEWMNKATEDDQPNQRLFLLLRQCFLFLEDGKDAQIVARLFELKMLESSGYNPVLDRCASCGSVQGTFTFSVREGGLLCGTCSNGDELTHRISPASFNILRVLHRMEPDRLGNIQVKTQTKDELRLAIWAFIDYHTPFQFKSRIFLEKMADLFEE